MKTNVVVTWNDGVRETFNGVERMERQLIGSEVHVVSVLDMFGTEIPNVDGKDRPPHARVPRVVIGTVMLDQVRSYRVVPDDDEAPGR